MNILIDPSGCGRSGFMESPKRPYDVTSVDAGINLQITATTRDGGIVFRQVSARTLSVLQHKLTRLQRRLARQVSYLNRHNVTLRRIRKIRTRIVCIREDVRHKATVTPTKVTVQDPPPRNMVKKPEGRVQAALRVLPSRRGSCSTPTEHNIRSYI